MADINIAQNEQILKSLEHSFKEVGNQHKQALKALAKSQAYVHLMADYLYEAWSQALNLFVKIEQSRLTRFECHFECQMEQQLNIKKERSKR